MIGSDRRSANDIVILLRPPFLMPVNTYTCISSRVRPQSASFQPIGPLVNNMGTPPVTTRVENSGMDERNVPLMAEWAFRKPNPNIYAKLYGDAKTLNDRRSDLAKKYEEKRLKSEKEELELAKLRIHDSANLCTDTRSHEMRETELLQKRLKWSKKRVDMQRRKEEEELRECTFAPDIRKRLKS